MPTGPPGGGTILGRLVGAGQLHLTPEVSPGLDHWSGPSFQHKQPDTFQYAIISPHHRQPHAM